MSTACPICESPLRSQTPNIGEVIKYDCPRCGSFELVGSLVGVLPGMLSQDRDAATKLSHAIRQANERKEPLALDTDLAKEILKRPLPSPSEQADLLIRWLATNVPDLGETVNVNFDKHGSLIGSKSRAGFEMVVEHLITSDLIKGRILPGGGLAANVTLTFKGWAHYENLKLGGKVYRKGFMAMKYGDPELNDMLESVFKPAAKRAGFDLFKSDDIPKAGLIDDLMRVGIQSADFLIADLTHDNPGAYWEAGYAEGLGKPVIYTCEKSKFESEQTHFDTSHHLTIVWDKADRKSSGVQLAATIRATLPHIARLVDEEI